MAVSAAEFLEERSTPRPAEAQLRGLDFYGIPPEGGTLADRARGELDEGRIEGRDEETERAELSLTDFIAYTISIRITGLCLEREVKPEALSEKVSERRLVATPAEGTDREISSDPQEFTLLLSSTRVESERPKVDPFALQRNP